GPHLLWPFSRRTAARRQAADAGFRRPFVRAIGSLPVWCSPVDNVSERESVGNRWAQWAHSASAHSERERTASARRERICSDKRTLSEHERTSAPFRQVVASPRTTAARRPWCRHRPLPVAAPGAL